jgi:aerobic-type carbon monoxide dehydrogenase small subunit (CoxS/CutS family)
MEGIPLPDVTITPGVANPRLTAAVSCSQTFTTHDERKVTTPMKKQVCRCMGSRRVTAMSKSTT